MEIQHVRHFLAAAETGNLTRAAEALGIAQPALSQSLKRMEDKLGGAKVEDLLASVFSDVDVPVAHSPDEDAAVKRAQNSDG